ncbi:IS256 family transposase [Bradyrhizobium sp. CCGUVB14]|uniref:IS256 family transposase n=1 Tax=Bradyrhizobium sp. CCGUVB14 TaxID=2949628 RepID=UPI0020B2079B|nr:IS256 family transposase [Bradyrhizobium sp. CCGUVB14]MCP3441036.1 IS256 family transposase [Bradyrhizobium sp. CCGUVB14]MCP3441213.1 IS256 family transposase [Bradyrhizobium sp. CCGUVB14]
MTETTNVLAFRQPSTVDDPLTDILRAGARELLARAIEIEVDTFLASTSELTLPDGRARLVRHGYGPARQIQTGIGPVEVARPKVRDRGACGANRIRFSSAILPLWARRTKSLDALLPVLYLRGISTGDFQDALSALLGKDAPNLSASVIARLTADWQAEYERWQRRDLSARRYVYLWADGVYLQARMEDHSECILVLVGATPEGRKELVGFQVGARESAQSWRELLIDVKQRGLRIAPEVAVGDGALGFWKALDEVFPGTRHQRCWCHKVSNVLDKVAKSVQGAMKNDLRNVYLAPSRAKAETAIDTFVEKYRAKYGPAVECLIKDREALLAFFDFPAEHWAHLRTSNPIESVFATVRHRTVRTKGSLSPKTAKLMVFKLIDAASKTWRRLKGTNQLPKVIAGVKFTDGIEVTPTTESHAA